MHEPDQETHERPLVSRRGLDIGVGIAFLVVALIVIIDSRRLGFSWRANEGPMPGYFPFYIASVMIIASAFNLFSAWRDRRGSRDIMITVEGFGRMSAVFVPAIVYVFAISYIGIYVASAIYIAGFMIAVGKFGWLRAVLVGSGVALVCFAMFEIWFLVPLPKGPIETALGF